MKTIIKKAIEGGYKKYIGIQNINEYWCVFELEDTCTTQDEWGKVETKQQTVSIRLTELVCDSLFWQALGKACGWETASQTECACGREISNWKSVWIINALKFHEINLTKEWDEAVEDLKKLIKEKCQKEMQ